MRCRNDICQSCLPAGWGTCNNGDPLNNCCDGRECVEGVCREKPDFTGNLACSGSSLGPFPMGSTATIPVYVKNEGGLIVETDFKVKLYLYDDRYVSDYAQLQSQKIKVQEYTYTWPANPSYSQKYYGLPFDVPASLTSNNPVTNSDCPCDPLDAPCLADCPPYKLLVEVDTGDDIIESNEYNNYEFNDCSVIVDDCQNPGSCSGDGDCCGGYQCISGTCGTCLRIPPGADAIGPCDDDTDCCSDLVCRNGACRENKPDLTGEISSPQGDLCNYQNPFVIGTNRLISVRITNEGAVPTDANSNFKVKLYLYDVFSPQANIHDHKLWEYEVQSPLSANGRIYPNPTFEVPSGLTPGGNYRFLLEVDPEGDIDESNEGNNDFTDCSVIIDDPQNPISCTLDTDCLGGNRCISGTCSPCLRIPPGADAIGPCDDDTDCCSDLVCRNGACRENKPDLTGELFNTPNTPLPAQVCDSTYANPLVMGTRVSILANITNIGTIATDAGRKFNVKLYLDDVYTNQDEPDHELGEYEIDTQFGVNTQLYKPLRFDVPSGLTPGSNYRFLLEVDPEGVILDSDRSNNDFADCRVTLEESVSTLPDVTLYEPPVYYAYPSFIMGRDERIGLDLYNPGTEDITESFQNTVCLDYPVGDCRVVGTRTVDSLTKGYPTARVWIPVRMPTTDRLGNDIPPGVYDLKLRLDASSKINENDEMNNAFILRQTLRAPPDLKVERVYFNPPKDNIDVGSLQALNVKIKNEGSEVGTFKVNLYLVLSSDTTLSSPPRFPVSEYHVPYLNSGESIEKAQLFNVPNLVSAEYKFRVIVDADNEYDEGSHEDNNALYSDPVTIGGTEPLPANKPDLQVVSVIPQNNIESFSSENAVSIGEYQKIEITVRNNGNAESGQFDVVLSLPDYTKTIRGSPLGPGLETTLDMIVNLPNTLLRLPVQPYQLYTRGLEVVVDPGNNIDESEEGNNQFIISDFTCACSPSHPSSGYPEYPRGYPGYEVCLDQSECGWGSSCNSNSDCCPGYECYSNQCQPFEASLVCNIDTCKVDCDCCGSYNNHRCINNRCVEP